MKTTNQVQGQHNFFHTSSILGLTSYTYLTCLIINAYGFKYNSCCKMMTRIEERGCEWSCRIAKDMSQQMITLQKESQKRQDIAESALLGTFF